jgi:hypothetical protein
MLFMLDADGKTDCGMETRSFAESRSRSSFALSDFPFSKINAERRTQSGKSRSLSDLVFFSLVSHFDFSLGS